MRHESVCPNHQLLLATQIQIYGNRSLTGILLARRPGLSTGLSTSSSPLRYPTALDSCRITLRLRSSTRLRTDRVSAHALETKKPGGVYSCETAHLTVFTSGGASTGPAGLVFLSQSQTGGGRKCLCCCPVLERPVETDCIAARHTDSSLNAHPHRVSRFCLPALASGL